MSVQVILNFATIAEAIAALSGGVPATAVVSATAQAEVPKPDGRTRAARSAAAPAPAAAVASPASAPAPAAAAPATPQEGAMMQTQGAAQAPELPYPPIGERIAAAVATTNPRNVHNRTALRALFGSLVHKDGPDKPVKTGQDVKPGDRPLLVAALDKLDAEAKAAETEGEMA